MARTPLIAGNWKMNHDHLEAISTTQRLAFAFPKDGYEYVDIALIVPFTDLRSVQTLVEGDKLQISFGAQDVSAHDKGAYTGEISAAMLEKLGCSWVVVGHSERREYHSEDNALVAQKAKQALAHGMSPIVCVGEPLDVREAGSHVDYVVKQTRESLAGLSAEDISRVVVAYEPVWAIGTGKVASATDAQEVCHAIRALIAELADATTAESVRILYGGSVKTDTIGETVSQSDVDGALVGGASLDGQEFARLAAAAANAVK
ncbi:triose-phosphate isomerase [Corynebacterium sp. LK2510]|uniref:triose-phosphate isomerase n=1 Tax=Corynebacterium sp. LK2510 TaxID=3110472 RepID=UPI0034D001A1